MVYSYLSLNSEKIFTEKQKKESKKAINTFGEDIKLKK